MSKFKVGDMVKTEVGYSFDGEPCIVCKAGEPNYVKRLPHDGCVYSAWDDRLIKITNDQKIIITHDNHTTKARLYEGDKLVKTAEAKCSPSDTFDFTTGAKMAFNRLMFGTSYHPSEVAIRPDKQEPIKLYCVKDSNIGRPTLTQGRVYEFVDGRMVYDNGYRSRTRDFTWDAYKRNHADYAQFLIPLISRPAKVGEWVYVTGSKSETGRSHDYAVGEIHKVFKKCNQHHSVWFDCDGKGNVALSDYLVLDGFNGEIK